MTTAIPSKGPSCSLIPSLIAACCLGENTPENPKPETSELSEVVQTAWDCIWDQASPDRFIDRLLCEKTLDFRGNFTGPDAIRLFSRHIYPLLVDMATAPLERESLSRKARDLRLKNCFVVIIPRFGKTCIGSGSFSARCHQGIPLQQLFGQSNLSSEELLRKTNSYVIEFLIDDPRMELLIANDLSWHLGTVCHRSALAHEWDHIAEKMKEDMPRELELHNDLSWRWTHGEEARAIREENRFLQARGELTRASHKYAFSSAEFGKKNASTRLVYSLMLGADGSVKALCDQHLASPVESDDRIACHSDALQMYADAYLRDVPSDEEMLSATDDDFRRVARKHKQLALESLFGMFIQGEQELGRGLKLVRDLTEEILKQAPRAGRTDVIPFAKGWQKRIQDSAISILSARHLSELSLETLKPHERQMHSELTFRCARLARKS